MNKFIKFWVIGILLAGCAHQVPFETSEGHIDSRQQASAVAPVGDVPKPVKSAALLTPPKPKVKEQTYSVVVNDVPVKEILFALARESKVNVDIRPGISGSVTLNAVNQTLPAILDRIANQVDLTYKIENGVWVIAPDLPVLRTYQINYLNIDTDTSGGISVTNQLASTTANNNAGVTGSTSTATGQNKSTTEVKTATHNHFWDDLIHNIEDILRESDKQLLISRIETDSRLQAEYDGNAEGNGSLAMNASKDRRSTKGESATKGADANPTGGGIKASGDETVSSSMSENVGKRYDSYKTLYAAKIIANKQTGVLSIRATQRQHEKIREFIDRVQESARRQVMIEATIVEVKLSNQFSAGIDWSRLGNGFTLNQQLTGGALAGSASSFVVGYANNSNPALASIKASISLLEGFGKTKVLSSPKMVVLNSQTAILKVVDNLVYFTVSVTPATVSTTGGVLSPAIYTTTPNTMPVGLWMSVTPQINENGEVTLDIRPTIARSVGNAQDPNPALGSVPNLIPQIQVREMASILRIPNGSTAILGGMMQDDIETNREAVPGVATLPFIGKLFQNKNDVATKTELVIFLKPTVVTNPHLDSNELRSFKQYLPDQLPPMTDDEPVN